MFAGAADDTAGASVPDAGYWHIARAGNRRTWKHRGELTRWRHETVLLTNLRGRRSRAQNIPR